MSKSSIIGLLIILVLFSSIGYAYYNKIIPNIGNIRSFQYVDGSRIRDENGNEIMWRGAGGSYLFHTTGDAYQTAWQNHISNMQYMGFNTFRLAFSFADSAGGHNADILNFTKLDWILDFLDDYNIKVILDLHNYLDMAEDFGSQKLVNDWVAVATRYSNESRIVAYELFNEPYEGSGTWATNITSTEDVFNEYKRLRNAVYNVDPNHIVIFQSKNYMPINFWTYRDQIPNNVVFTHHEWWTNENDQIILFGAENLSLRTISYPMYMREQLNRPFWLGEFGTDNGGNHYPFDNTNLEDQVCEQLLYRCEEYVEGWNLWQGSNLNSYPIHPKELFPLKIYNPTLEHKPFIYDTPNLLEHIVANQWSGVDFADPSQINMWHSGDYVTLSPNIIVKVIVKSAITGEERIEIKNISVETRITHTNPNPLEDWNTYIYSLGYI